RTGSLYKIRDCRVRRDENDEVDPDYKYLYVSFSCHVGRRRRSESRHLRTS
uniref:Uncharacterized protein n=1 Tax=Trichobilharzia regenti TaxID=157069 RepID=A0AA85JSD8_TRIRE